MFTVNNPIPRTDTESTYPLVYCEHHHKARPGYAVCVHIVNGVGRVGHYQAPTEYELGHIFCERCTLALESECIIETETWCAFCAEKNLDELGEVAHA